MDCPRPVVLVISLLLALPLAAQGNKKEKADPVGGISGDGYRLEWQPTVDHERLALAVIAPDGSSFQKEFQRGRNPVFNISDIPGGAIDGIYTYELRVIPHVPPGILNQLTVLRDEGRENEALRLRFLSGLGDTLVQSGGFTVLNGSFVPTGDEESGSGSLAWGAGAEASSQGGRGRAVTRPGGAGGEGPVEALDQVIPDDLIVQGSLCVGFDCVNNENFGFDTIRLKENNTRIKFEDTSVGAFPTTDWQLTANESNSGSANKFSIEDITGGKIPFTILGGAPTNSLFVSNVGNVGIQTAAPVLDLHMKTTDTPGIRFEQTNEGGFSAQTWDVAGNEANFFVRDVTGGSRLSFRIRPGAPTSSLDIAASGFVGLNTGAPSSRLHVFGTADGPLGARVFVEETRAPAGNRELLTLQNNGRPVLRLTNSSVAASTGTTLISGPSSNGTVSIFNSNDNAATKVGIGAAGNASYTLDVTGDLRVTGTIFGTVSGASIGNGGAQAGAIARSEFAGGVASVELATPFPHGGYAITLTPVSSTANLVFHVSSKSSHGFTVATTQPLDGLVELDWVAVPFSRSVK